jgi:hypothetical protein
MASAKEISVCTLAFGERYHLMTQNLAQELAAQAPEVTLVVYTDKPSKFDKLSNVKAFQHHQQGILHCYIDKFYLMEKAFSITPVAIHVDADSRLLQPLSSHLNFQPGLTGRSENLIEHVQRYRPKNLPDLQRVAAKIGLTPDQWADARWIGESLFVMTVDEGRERSFLQLAQKIAVFMELQGMHGGEGSFMGLALAKSGYAIHEQGYRDLRGVIQHLSASSDRPAPSFWLNLRKRVGFQYRRSRTIIKSLQDFQFYHGRGSLREL